MLLDTTHKIETPEGVELSLPLAGLAPRSLAWLIDTLIKVVVFALAAAVFSVLGRLGFGLILLLAFLLLWFYDVIFEVFNHGATPGKSALNLRVMNINGTPVGWSGSLIRNLIRFVDSLPGVFFVGFVSVLLSPRFQRLGDLAANTIVVHAAANRPAQRAGTERVEPVKIPLTPSEQQAVVSFGERAPQISDDRAEELAALLEPLFGEVDADKLRGYASWIAGGSDRS
ncbi:MAG: RDD family protein [Pseudomonadota bacterium]